MMQMNDNLALFVSAILTCIFVIVLMFLTSFLSEINQYVAFFFVVVICVGMIIYRFKS